MLIDISSSEAARLIRALILLSDNSGETLKREIDELIDKLRKAISC